MKGHNFSYQKPFHHYWPFFVISFVTIYQYYFWVFFRCHHAFLSVLCSRSLVFVVVCWKLSQYILYLFQRAKNQSQESFWCFVVVLVYNCCCIITVVLHKNYRDCEYKEPTLTREAYLMQTIGGLTSKYLG